MIQQNFDLCKFLARNNPSLITLLSENGKDINIVEDHAKIPNVEFVKHHHASLMKNRNAEVLSTADKRWDEQSRQRQQQERSSSSSSMQEERQSRNAIKARRANRRKTYPAVDRRWDNSSSHSSPSTSTNSSTTSASEGLVCPIRR